MRIYKASEVPQILGRWSLEGENRIYSPTAWGRVLKDEDLLIGTRLKNDDPHRYGQFSMPAGRVEKSDYENFLKTAMRETYEETDVVGRHTGLRFTHDKGGTILKLKDNLVAAVQPDGMVWAHYFDSGKNYMGFMFDLLPLTDPKQKERVFEDPRYIPLMDVIESNGEDFTPLSKVFFDLIGQDHGRDIISEKAGDIVIDCNDLSRYLKMGPV